MAKFREKPTEVEAFQYKTGVFQSDLTGAIPSWIIAALADRTLFANPNQREQLVCRSSGAVYQVNDGDWIIKSVGGQISVCSAEGFAINYEPADA